MSEKLRVCFVCLGNICRSPLAEAVLREKARARGVDDRLVIASRGIGAWHVGDPPDARMRLTAADHGVDMDGVAEQVGDADFHEFDLLLAMDADRHADLVDKAPPSALERVVPFRAFDPEGHPWDDVPDPYYGGQRGFENVYEIVDRTCEVLLDRLLDGTFREVPGGPGATKRR